jgi:hypothetical protein
VGNPRSYQQSNQESNQGVIKEANMRTPTIYQITVQEKLDEQWAEWFVPLTIHYSPAGDTMLRGPIRDQSELHGILAKLRDLNLTLVEVSRCEL